MLMTFPSASDGVSERRPERPVTQMKMERSFYFFPRTLIPLRFSALVRPSAGEGEAPCLLFSSEVAPGCENVSPVEAAVCPARLQLSEICVTCFKVGKKKELFNPNNSQ